MQYSEFRKQVVIHILDTCDEGYKDDLPSRLTNLSEFKTYFDKKIKPNQTRWYVFMNNADSVVVQSILSEFIAFKEATLYLLTKVDIEDEEAHAFLHKFNAITAMLISTSVDDYNSMRLFCSYLRDIFAGFNSLSGSRGYDYFTKIFNKI